MPIPAPGNVDAASQTTLTAVKNGQAKPVYYELLPRRGKPIAGAWLYSADASATIWKTDLANDIAGYWQTQVGNQNDEYSYPAILLAAGDWKFDFVTRNAANAGIVSVYHGTTLLGTVDTYAAAPTYNNTGTVSFTIAADTTAAIRLVMATKNAASAAYALFLQRAILWRVA